jgi:hypothetical protein
MRISIQSRMSLASVALLWLVGCAHQQSSCTSCQTANKVASSTKATPCTSCANNTATSASVPVWNVVRDNQGGKNSFVAVSTETSAPAKAPTALPATTSTVKKEPAPLTSAVINVPLLPVPDQSKQSVSLKVAATPSPYNQAPAASIPAETVSLNMDLKIPEQKIDVISEAKAPALEEPKVLTPVNPNLKPGIKEIVRENVQKTYAHGDDYTWVMGELEYLNAKKVWRVRYARYDQDDKFGGCFTIVGCEEKLQRFVNGDMVKIEGFVVDAETQSIAPEYKVTEIVPLVTREVVDVKVEEKK